MCNQLFSVRMLFINYISKDEIEPEEQINAYLYIFPIQNLLHSGYKEAVGGQYPEWNVEKGKRFVCEYTYSICNINAPCCTFCRGNMFWH